LAKMTKKKVVAPDTFNTTYEENCVGCHAEGQQGYLYPLERALIYVHKPTIHIRYDDIVSAEMLRANQFSAVQSFDLDVEMKGSGGDTKSIIFRGIPKSEYKVMKGFLEEKKVKLKVPKQKAEQVSSMGAFDSDDDGEGDPYKQQLLREHSGNGDDSDSENDSDFKAGSESSVDEEYGSDDSGSGAAGSGDDAEGGDGEKKKKKKRKKRKHEEGEGGDAGDAGDGDGDGDGDGGGAKKKKKKAAKDPDAPKLPASAYVLFCADARVQLAQEQPDLNPADVMKELGVKWKAADEEARKPYAAANAEAKLKYVEEKEAYRLKLIAEGRMPAPKARSRAAPKGKMEKDPNAPKKPIGSFFLYVGEMREKIKADYPEVQKHTEVSKKAGELWKALEPEAKKVYEDKAAALKAEYNIAFTAYKESDGGKAFIAAAKLAAPPAARAPRAAGSSKSKQSTLTFKSEETIEDSDDD